jgi:hypothetical protein
MEWGFGASSAAAEVLSLSSLVNKNTLIDRWRSVFLFKGDRFAFSGQFLCLCSVLPSHHSIS